MAKNENRCWPGYEPVKGKKQHEKGSCRPKSDSKLTDGEKKFRAKRDRQLESWKKEHPGSPRKAAQHLHKPGTEPKTAAKKAVTKKKAAARKKSAAKKKSVKKA